MPVCLSRVWTEAVVWNPVRGLSASVRRAGQDRPAISVSLLYNISNCSDLPSVIGQQFSYLKRNRVIFSFFLKENIWDKDMILKWNITQNFRSLLKHDANLLWVFPLPQMKMTAVQTRAITAVCAWTWWTLLNASVRRSGPERRVSLVCVSSLPLSVPPLQQCAFPSLSLCQGVFVQKSNFRGNRVRFGRI